VMFQCPRGTHEKKPMVKKWGASLFLNDLQQSAILMSAEEDTASYTLGAFAIHGYMATWHMSEIVLLKLQHIICRRYCKCVSLPLGGTNLTPMTVSFLAVFWSYDHACV
jgi:hypothetical protein